MSGLVLLPLLSEPKWLTGAKTMQMTATPNAQTTSVRLRIVKPTSASDAARPNQTLPVG